MSSDLACQRCGTGLPDDAKYCLRCGKRIRSEAGPGAPAAAGDECTIVWWRGYMKSGFFAFATGERARTPELGSSLGSSLFRKIGGGPPVPVPEGRALEAHRALVERMQSEGWEPVGCGTHWYETRLRLTRGPEAVKDAAVDSSPGRPLAVPAPLPRATANHAEKEQRREGIRRHGEKKVLAAKEEQANEHQKEEELCSREEAKNLQSTARAAAEEQQRRASPERVRWTAALDLRRRRAEGERRRELARRLAAEQAPQAALAPEVITRISQYGIMTPERDGPEADAVTEPKKAPGPDARRDEGSGS